MVAMLLSAMHELVEMKNWPDWDRVLNLSESDYPVKTQEERQQGDRARGGGRQD